MLTPWPIPQFLIFSNPFTTPDFCEGCDAFCLGGFSAFGLRVSRLDFFWDLAIWASFAGRRPGCWSNLVSLKFGMNSGAFQNAPLTGRSETDDGF
jgi:hypothetical protein